MVASNLPTIHGLGSDLGGGNVDSNFPRSAAAKASTASQDDWHRQSNARSGWLALPRIVSLGRMSIRLLRDAREWWGES